MEERFNLEKTPIIINGTMYVQILPDIQRYLDIKVNKEGKVTTPLRMIPDISKHGKFIGVWNPKQENKSD